MLLLVFILLIAPPAQAVSLYWDSTYDGQLDVELKVDGQWTFIRRVPAHPPFFEVEAGKFGDYRVTIPNGPSSNSARYSVDVVVEAPPMVNNMTVKQLDMNRVEIVGQACTSLKTTGTGLRRIVECLH